MFKHKEAIVCIWIQQRASKVVLVVKNLPANAGDTRDAALGSGIHWSRKWQPFLTRKEGFLLEPLPRKFLRQRSLVGYSPCGLEEWDTTEHTPILTHNIVDVKYLEIPVAQFSQNRGSLWKKMVQTPVFLSFQLGTGATWRNHELKSHKLLTDRNFWRKHCWNWLDNEVLHQKQEWCMWSMMVGKEERNIITYGSTCEQCLEVEYNSGNLVDPGKARKNIDYYY